MAEQRKHEQENIYREVHTVNKSKIGLIIGGIFLVASGIFGVYFILQMKKPVYEENKNNQNVQAMIVYDQISYDKITDSSSKIDLINIFKSETDKVEKPGSIKSIFLTQEINGVKTFLPFADLIKMMKLTASGSLVRSLSDEYMIGTYTNTEGTSSDLFFVFRSKDYNHSYAGMLDWESTILDDMFSVFHIDVSGDNKSLFVKPFSDTFVDNKDARVLYDINNKPLLYYVFAYKDYLIITSSNNAIKEIISRLVTQNTKPL